MKAIVQAACPACGTGNRIAGGDAKAAKCGQCGAKLFTGAPVEVDDAGLAAHLRHTKGAVLLDVWAPWCGPCRMMAPHFADAARTLEPNVRFLKLNADHNASAQKLNVRGIPALILFRDGQEIARAAGFRPADQIVAWVRSELEMETA